MKRVAGVLLAGFLGAAGCVLGDAASPARPFGQVVSRVVGSCGYIDTSFGIPIAVTTITALDLRAASISLGDEIAVTIGDRRVVMPLDYPPSSVPLGAYLAYLLWGNLRVYLRGGDITQAAGMQPGTSIAVELVEKEKYSRLWTLDGFDRAWAGHRVPDVAGLPRLATAPSSLLSLHVDGTRVVDAAGTPVLLRGVAVEDPYTARAGSAPVLMRDFLYLRAAGANVIHVPIHPESWKLVGGDAYMKDYLDDLVQWGGKLGLYIALSWKTHGVPETGEADEARYDPSMELALDALTLLAHRYDNCPWVLYSVFNEPNALERWDKFRVCMTDLADAVRAENRDAIVIVPGVNIATDVSGIPGAPIERGNILYASDVYPWVWEKTPWKEDAEALLDAGFALIVFEWGFSSGSGQAHFARPADFGQPFVAFCDAHDIGWTAWVWSSSWQPTVMFDDYERLNPTVFGRLVLEAMYGGQMPAAQGQPPSISVEPEEARADGCMVRDYLAGRYGPAPATVVEAEAGPGWAFDRWEGTLEESSWTINSAALGATARAVFRTLGEAPNQTKSESSVPLEQPLFVIDDLKDGDFRNTLSDVWRTLTQEECEAGGSWQEAVPGQDNARSLRQRHVSAAIVDRQGENWVDWSFDVSGWVVLRTWLHAPYDAARIKGVYLVVDCMEDIDLSLAIDYRQTGSTPWEDAGLRSASAPVHLAAGRAKTIAIPFDEFTVDDQAWAAQGGNSLEDIDRSWLESIGLVAVGDANLTTVYVREIGFYGVGN